MAKPNIRTPFIRPSLDPHKLAHFLAVYQTGSFSGAAIDNSISQQAVSKSIARLEESLGVALFERTSFGARPTRFADRLAARAQAIVAEGRLAAAELAAMRGAERGYVRIGLGWSFLPRIAPDTINRFKRVQPDVTVSIMTGDSGTLYKALLSGDLEFVASAPPESMPVDPTLRREPLFVEHDMLTMRRDHPLAGTPVTDLERLARQTWLLSMQLQPQWERICDIFLSREIAPPANFVDLDSVILVKAMLLQSDGVALLAPELFAQEHERELYAMIPETAFTTTRTAYLAQTARTDLQPYARMLRDTLHRSWQALVPRESWIGQAQPEFVP
ncbi:LysR family transcriptional regulator [Leptolyngbya sp. 15MV]|nr:LysR family transcriptional regulator [Leptolyngbya sp. 15MV]